MTSAPDIGPAPLAGPRRLSEVLRDLEAGLGPRIALGDLVAGLRDRSFAPLMVLFAVPNVFLYLPGSSALTGVPLMILALQLIVGRPSVWLPAVLSDRSVDRASFARIVRHSLPWIERIERLARPRLWPGGLLPGGTALIDRLIGIACFVMALLLFLPIPFANGAPALAIAALGLAISERDGLWLAAGLAASVAATILVAAIVGGSVLAIAHVF